MQRRINMIKPVKAIVLTYDKYRSFTDHMILCYEKLWPNNPFIFHVPYQELSPTIQTSKVEYHLSPSDIKGTVQTLLHGLDDEEMIYWCIDDKYPIKLDVKRIKRIHNYLMNRNNENICGILYCRCRGMLDNENLTGNTITDKQGHIWLERKNYEQIWFHQYLKVKVLRHLFDSFPDKIADAKSMDYLKTQVEKPQTDRLFVTQENLAIFGESTSRGVITKNCLHSMKNNNLPIPSWVSEVTPNEIILGNPPKSMFSRIISKVAKLFN